MGFVPASNSRLLGDLAINKSQLVGFLRVISRIVENGNPYLSRRFHPSRICFSYIALCRIFLVAFPSRSATNPQFSQQPTKKLLSTFFLYITTPFGNGAISILKRNQISLLANSKIFHLLSFQKI